jgi:pimeloyl-ACP methyl ester carboxylesterase
VGFAPAVQGLTWAGVRVLLCRAPELGLRLLFADLSTLPAGPVVARLSPGDRAAALGLFSLMRSGAGFRNDLAATEPVGPADQPTLVIATRRDGAVSFDHARVLAAGPTATLLESDADSHLIWFSPDWPAVAARMCDFITAGLPG